MEEVNKISILKRHIIVAAMVVFTTSISPQTLARDETMIEEMVITGTRREVRSVYESSVPIDVISSQDLRNQGASDLTDLIRNVVPSFNVQTHAISDAATLVRPTNLRGLASDHTLVLVNGKRRHRSSVITWLGNGVSDGAQGPDISVFPSIALKQVEVLRDGASAQYGSDAIAGVMNFILKDSTEGGTLEAKYGNYTEYNEAAWTLSGNVGFPLSDNGFANLSFEYGVSDPTNRSVQRTDAIELIAGGNTAVTDPAQIWGSPDIRENLKTVWNLGIDIGNASQVYLFGNYAGRESEGGFFFRNPDTRGGVFVPAGGDGTQRLVGDTTGDMSGNCPAVQVGDNSALGTVMANPNCFVYNEMFPGGFTPSFGAKIVDFSTIVGMRKYYESGLNYDISASYGYSDSSFFISNTVNASLGPQTPTTFEPGDYTQIETNFNADFGYPIQVSAFASDLNVAGGFEWRKEAFEITLGDQASWEIGPLADQGFLPASNGFSGFSPQAAGNWSRSNIAAYIDLEADITDRWLVGIAGRWENFADFGTTTNGKISTYFALTDRLAIRSSYSTGFRAPTPGQSNAFNVSTEYDASIDDLVNNGTIPSTNPLAKLRGGTDLDPEKSTNLTAGIVLQTARFSLTVDYFKIELSDRLAISRLYELTNDERENLLESGVTSAATIQRFRFFTNEIDTTSEGFDVVGTWSTESHAGVTDFTLAYNRTNTTVDSGVTENVDQTRIDELEDGLPKWRANLGINHAYNNWHFMARYNHYAGWYDSEDSHYYGGYGTLDAEVGYSFINGASLAMGATNITDATPDKNPHAAATVGNQYSQFAPGGFNGAFWYARMIYDF
ncbi:MAG: TonB-dependent receptor [Nitrosomonadaceae bacterium]